MKNLKKPIILAITVVIAGLVLMSTASSLTYEGQKVISEQSEIIYSTEIPISAHATISNLNHVKIITTNPIDKLSRDTDVLIHSGEQDFQNPVVVSDNSMNNVLVFAEKRIDLGQTGMSGRISTDGGITWGDESINFDAIPPPEFGDPDDVSQPKLDLYDGKEAWGTFTAGGKYNAMAYCLTLPDITDPTAGENGWSYYYIDWDSQGFSDFDSADVACYPNNTAHSPNEAFWGLVAGTGDRPLGTDEENDTFWFTYFLPGDQSTLISFYSLDNDAHKLVCDIDISKYRPYIAYEYTSETDPSDIGTRFVRLPSLRPDNYPDDNWWSGNVNIVRMKNLFNPDITAIDGKVYIVGSTIDGDIRCYYSSNMGGSFHNYIVSDENGEENYSHITALSANRIICSYTRNGNIYAKASKDCGVTWGDEIQINDNSGTVVEQYSCSGITGPFAVWTDERAAPLKEIYFDTTFEVGSPPETPTVTGPTKLKPGQSKEFTFTTTEPDGEQIYYYVDWGDGNNSGWQGPYTSGTPYKASHKWAEKAKFTIQCKAKDINDLESSYGNLEINTPRNSGLMLRFLDYFQHVFPNLWELLGL